MTYNSPQIRSATSAIAAVFAAVFALSATPLFAQDADVPDSVPETTAEPVTDTLDPLAPEPAAPETPVVTDTATQPAKVSKPVAKAKAAAPRPTATAQPSATRTSATTTSAPVTIAAPAARELIDAPVAPTAEAASPPSPTPVDTTAADQAQQMDNMLELAGAAGLALLAAGVALRSRRRRKEEERVEEAKWAIIEASPDVESLVEPEPAFVRTPAPMNNPAPTASAAPARAPVTKLPSGFDLSRFGPHVQAAYRGPTPDNPSLSLRYRLRRASFLDQQARRAASQAATRPAVVAPAQTAKAQPAQPAYAETRFMFRRAGAKNGAKPAYQH